MRLIPDSNVPAFIKRLSRFLPDSLYIQLRYFSRFRRFINMRNPRTFNEKLQWLKLNHRVPGEWKLVDKYEVKDVVAQRIGREHIIPTLAVYDRVDDIDLDELPRSFVLKCTHDSGGVALVRDKHSADIKSVREKLDASMARNYFYSSREPHYLEVRPRIIAEPYLEDKAQGQLLDYKFFCFDGNVKALFVGSDRASGNVKFDYFDAEFNPLHFRQLYPTSAVPPERPAKFETMLDLARKLSEGFPHVRVDLYQVNGSVYFGEMTFFHFGGMQPFRPEKWDYVFGDWLTLPAPAQRR